VYSNFYFEFTFIPYALNIPLDYVASFKTVFVLWWCVSRWRCALHRWYIDCSWCYLSNNRL